MVQIAGLVLLSMWACVQNLLYWTYLPERVAIHFGPDGTADSWLDRERATILMLALQVVLPWMMVAIARGIRYLPVSVINVPNREYWFQPERRDATLAYVTVWMVSFAIAESVLISVVNHLSFVANRTGEPLNMRLCLVALAVFLSTTLVLVIKMYKRFALPKNSGFQLR